MDEKKKLTKADIIISISTILIILSLFAIAFMFVKNYFSKENFVYEENLDKTVLTIEGYKYDLREASYYVMEMEAYVQQIALAYNEDYPLSYWNLYISNRYVSSLARDNCMELIIRDYIYASEAKKLGLTLSEEKIKEINGEVNDKFKNMTASQMQITNYSEKELYDILCRIALAEAYVTDLMAKDTTLTEEDLNPEGTYLEKMKKNYNIKINNKIWDKISLGRITVNNAKKKGA